MVWVVKLEAGWGGSVGVLAAVVVVVHQDETNVVDQRILGARVDEEASEHRPNSLNRGTGWLQEGNPFGNICPGRELGLVVAEPEEDILKL